MTLLRDMRLLLIVGLAILCLLALRLCSSEYQPETIGSVSNDTAVADNASSGTQSDTQAMVSDAEPTTGSEQASAGDESSRNTEGQEPGADEQSAENTNTEEDGSTDGVTQAQEEAEAVDSDAGSVDQSSQEESNSTAEPVDSEASAVAAEPVSVPVEVVPSAIGEYTPIELQRIEINAPADSGELITDMQSDIDAVKDGVLQYNDKLDFIDTLIEEVKNPTN